MNAMKTSSEHLVLALVPALSALLLAGCTHLVKTPSEPFMGYTGRDKVHLKIGLNITGSLLDAKYELPHLGDTWVLPVGGYLATNAAVLARQTFDEVVDVSDGQLPANANVAAILTPKVVYAYQTWGATGLGECIVDVRVEWTLTDAAHKPIWVDTVQGRCVGQTKTKTAKLLKQALEDLLAKSQQRISSAPAIRQFADKKAG